MILFFAFLAAYFLVAVWYGRQVHAQARIQFGDDMVFAEESRPAEVSLLLVMVSILWPILIAKSVLDERRKFFYWLSLIVKARIYGPSSIVLVPWESHPIRMYPFINGRRLAVWKRRTLRRKFFVGRYAPDGYYVFYEMATSEEIEMEGATPIVDINCGEST